jgi:hypothetical protein
VAGRRTERERRAEHRRAHVVGDARDDEEGDAAPRDPFDAHPALAQGPRSERESADTAKRQEHVRRLLGHPDLVAEAPTEPAAEHAAKRDDVGQA